MKKYDIYGIGAAIVDTEVIVTDSFLKKNEIDKGLMTLVEEERQRNLIDSLTTQRIPVKRSCGGSACNTVVAASRFGSKAFYSGKVATDNEGNFFVKDLKRAGVDFHEVEATSGITGKCLVMVTPDAERTMNTYLGASLELSSNEIDLASLENSNWLYIEGYLVTDDARTGVARDAMIYAKQKGVKTSLSLSDPFVVDIFSDNIRTIIGNDGMSTYYFVMEMRLEVLLTLIQLKQQLKRLSNMLRHSSLLEGQVVHWSSMVKNLFILQVSLQTL